MFRRLAIISMGGAAGIAALAVVSLRVAAALGAGPDLDAYVIAVAGPSVILSLLTTMISPLVTPRLARLDPHAAARRAGEWALIALIAGAVLTALIVLCRGLIVVALAPGTDAATQGVAQDTLAIYVLSLPVTIAAGVYSAYGFATGRVYVSGLSTTVYALTWFGLLLIPAFVHSAPAIALAGVLASQVQLAVAFIASRSSAGFPWPRWRLPARPRAAVRTVTGVAANAAIGKTNLVLDPVAGSLLGHGAVSIMGYATRLFTSVVALCGQGPAMALLADREPRSGPPSRGAERAIGATVLISAGVATIVALAAGPLVVLLLAHGRFTTDDAASVGRLVQAYAPAILLMTVAWGLESVLYAAMQVRVIFKLSAIALVVNVGLSLALVTAIGTAARPIGVGLAMLVYVVLLARRVSAMPEGPNLAAAVPAPVVARLVASIAVVGGIALLAEHELGLPPLAGAAATAVAGMALIVATARSWLAMRQGDPPENEDSAPRAGGYPRHQRNRRLPLIFGLRSGVRVGRR